MVAVLGYVPVQLNLTRGGGIIRTKNVLGGGFYGVHCHNGVCSSSDTEHNLSGMNYTIWVSDSWSGQSRNGRQYTIIHEYGHRAMNFVDSVSADDWSENMYRKFLGFGSPTNNARSNRLEYFADTFGVYTWENSTGNLPPRNGATSLSSIVYEKWENSYILLERETLDEYFTSNVIPLIRQ